MSIWKGHRRPAIELRRIPGDPERFMDLETGQYWTCIGLTSDLDHFICYEPCCLDDMPSVIDASRCKCFPVFSPNGSIVPRLLDIFAGTGAVGRTFSALGFQTIASLDIGDLACSHLRQLKNGITIQGDISDPKVLTLLHDTLIQAGVEGFCLSAGFPCQPFSRQGLMQGTDDLRFGAFEGLVTAIKCLKPRLVFLECVPLAAENQTVRKHLQQLCDRFGWEQREICLELGHQWPMNRLRWFCVLSDARNLPPRIPPWGIDRHHQSIQDVLPSFLPSTHHGMHELYLSQYELDCYLDARFGQDKRQLGPKDKCCTILHSYGSPLNGCPCGCRKAGFALASLVTKGLRGCFVVSPDHPAPRYLHADELRVLFALPPDLQLPSDQKQALCLVGLVAAPLQILWVMGHVILAASRTDEDIAPLDPAFILEEYKERILAFSKAPSHAQHILRIEHQHEPSWSLRFDDKASVADLVQAERMNLAWGHTVQVFSDDQSVDDLSSLSCHLDGLRLEHMPKKSKTEVQIAHLIIQIKICGLSHIAILPRGNMLFTFVDKVLDSRPALVVNADGERVPLDTRIWFPGSFIALTKNTFPCWPLRLSLEGRGTHDDAFPTSAGLYEAEVELLVFRFLHLQCIDPHLFWTARWIVDITELWPHEAHQRILHKWLKGGEIQGCRFGILWEANHWSAFLVTHHDNKLDVFIVDCQVEEVSSYMDLFFARVSKALHCHMYHIHLTHGIGQTFGTHCGAVAFLNVVNFLYPSADFTEQDAHNLYLRILAQRSLAEEAIENASVSTTLSWQLIGSGPDIQAQLAALIHSRGVLAEAKVARAQTIIQRLGVPTVVKILADKNPWAALKNAASKPGISLRILSDEEKAQYIEMRASTKHGAHIKDYKNKKEKSAPASSKDDITDRLVPSQLVLDPKMFKDENGDPVPQLQFSQVEADQHGLAICTIQEATAFLMAPKSISPHALGLLLLEPPEPDVMLKSGATKMRFPAQYQVTGEQVLIFGALLCIGDISIDRATAGSVSKQPVLPTVIIRYTLYRDQFQGSWQTFTEAPVREILKMFEPLNYCDGKNCGSACKKTHPDVDKTYEAVILELWGRHFTTAAGTKKTPLEADQFSFQVRTPAAIILSLVSNNPAGLYSDPRTDDFRVAHPDFCVIWINKVDFTQVERMSRTCSYALSIVRHRQRYGIRVKKIDEAKAWAELKPDQHFQPVKIEQIFEVSPVPHGTQKKTMEKVMREWNWNCRVLQPGRGSHFHMSWQVGAQEEPPARVLQAFQSDVLINPVRKVEVEQLRPKIFLAKKTQQHLRQAPSTTKEDQDPWLNHNDPWAKYAATSSTSAPLPPPTTAKRIEEIKGTLQQEVQNAVRKELESHPAGGAMSDTESGRLDHLESALQEVKSQNSALKGWIQDAQTKLNRQDAQLTQLKQEVGAQSEQMKTQFTNLQGELNQSFEKQFSRLEALLEKRQRHE